jgi:hypothetical protein
MLWNLLILGILGVLTPARAADIEFVTQELPWAIIDKPYSLGPLEVRSSGACPLGGVGYSAVGGVLPPGIEMSKLGYFSGTPMRTGVFGFAIRVSDGCTWVAQRFTLTVTGAPVITVSPDTLVFEGAGEKLVHISATWPRLSYGVTIGGATISGETAGAAWVKILPAHGFTPRETSALTADDVVVAVDPAALKPGHYSARITVTAWQALEAPTVAVELEVTEKRAPSERPTSVPRP